MCWQVCRVPRRRDNQRLIDNRSTHPVSTSKSIHKSTDGRESNAGYPVAERVARAQPLPRSRTQTRKLPFPDPLFLFFFFFST